MKIIQVALTALALTLTNTAAAQNLQNQLIAPGTSLLPR